MRNNKRIPVVLLILIAIALPLLLIGIKQTLDNRSSAAAADKLETEGGNLSGNALPKQDSSASGGSYVEFGINNCSQVNINVSQATSDGGFAWIVGGNFGTTPDNNTSPNQSRLKLFENGVEIGPAHAIHADIRNIGQGRFSHWSNTDGTGETIRFSSKDNSNPRSNGKTYSYCVEGSNPISSNPTSTPTQTANSPTPTVNPSGTLPAFPGAQGGGAVSRGGRGGAVIEVTNLNDSGTGSLRACIQASGPRTCVFRVGGTINLTSYLHISNPYITIAGQTAPGGGIQLNGKNSTQNMISTGTHNIIMRYIKIRKGYNSGCVDECGANLSIFSNSYNVIVDHVSSAWNQDEGLSAWNGDSALQNNITFSWNLVSEGLEGHSTGYISGAQTQAQAEQVTNLDLHHNLTMNNSHRNPLWKHKSGRIVNNLFYNQSFYTSQVGGGILADFIGNKYKKGPMYGRVYAGVREIEAFSGNGTTAPGTPSIYLNGNIGWNQTNPSGDQWLMTATTTGENGAETGAIVSSWRRTTPIANTTFPIIAEPVNNLETSILPTVGASQRLDCSGNWVSNRDTTDSRLINQYQTNTGINFIPANETQVGGFPTIASGTACTDTDHDGMPDTWENAKGLNPNNAADRNNIAPNGFTQLENYLNGV